MTPHAKAQHITYDTDPATPRGIVISKSMLDVKREQDAIRRGLAHGISEADCEATDAQLIACMVKLGMPMFAADQVRHSPTLRVQFYQTWVLVRGAARGDKEAAERVDNVRQAIKEGREAGTIADRPNMTVGLWER